MNIKIALVGNPNSGKTTLFNALTGSNQYVGNWPGVTVEKKEGKLKNKEGVIITDLPGIYSLSPYTLEEVVARNYLVNEKIDAILNIVDATNLERNLYLTTQLIELGYPVIIALNMMDIIHKRKEKIDTKELENRLGCKIIEISALKETNILEPINELIKIVLKSEKPIPYTYSSNIESSLNLIENIIKDKVDHNKLRWFSVKIFEKDTKVLDSLNLNDNEIKLINDNIYQIEVKEDDDSEAIIINERYNYISKILDGVYHKKALDSLSTSDKIDKIVTNKYLALPIFVIIMFVVYFISVTTVGTWVTDFTNDGLFGDGFHLFSIGGKEYSENHEQFVNSFDTINGAISFSKDNDLIIINNIENVEQALNNKDKEVVKSFIDDFVKEMNRNNLTSFTFTTIDSETLAPIENIKNLDDLNISYSTLDTKFNFIEPDAHDYGIYVDGIPVLIDKGLTAIHTWPWLKSLILNGVVAGVGAVLGFVPQILVLFLFLAFLEGCGYMSRIAFVLDRLFRKIGLSGKSFIPMLIGTGCSVPGIMASRTIENERDRKMTIMTTPFIPCGAKLPFIAMMAGALFNNAWWVAPSAYFLGIVAVIISGLILKKLSIFKGEAAPFVMELPDYHLPTFKNVMRSMWDRGFSFIKKAGTIILLSTIVLWFLSSYGIYNGSFTLISDELVEFSFLAYIGKMFSWIFLPLGFGNWSSSVAIVTGLIAKENIVATMGVIYGNNVYLELAQHFSIITGYAFLAFNLLCAPCFAAIGAIKREMNSKKWTIIAITYQTVFAYCIALMINGFGKLFTNSIVTGSDLFATVFSFPILIFILILIFRKDKNYELVNK